MIQDTATLSPWSSAFTMGWMGSGPQARLRCGWASLAVHFSSTLLQILVTRAAKAEHGSAGRQQGFICPYSTYSRLWSPGGVGDTWEIMFDKGHRTWPPSLFLWPSVLWIPCQSIMFFFSFAAEFDTNFSLSQQKKASSLTFIPHLKVKGWGDHTDYSR